jgi:AcrR family transcriptional regulator
VVVRAAITLFARFGYRNTTIATIAEAVGVTDASVLHYFESKRAILEAALDFDDVPANKEFLAYMEPGGLAALRNLANWGARMEENPETTTLQIVLGAESLSEGSELHGRFHQRYRYVRRRLVDAIERGIESGEIRRDIDAVHEATAFMAFIDGLRLQWFYADGAISLDEHLRAYVDHVIERIATPKTQRSNRRSTR